MARRDARRVLVLAVAVLVACALFFGWLRRLGRTPTPEERAREKAAELQEKARALTH